MFEFLLRLGLDTVMLWPSSEVAPPPLSAEDAQYLQRFRRVITDAQERGLESWIVQCPNVTARPEIAARPYPERHLYPFMQAVRLDQPDELEAYLTHRAAIQQILNNADGYVTIDGDPGGYPGAQPAEYLRVLQADREAINRIGTRPEHQKIIPWIWCGWGNDWVKNGPWNEPIEPLTEPVLELLKREMTEPWGLMPGRSIRDGWANGRINFELAEQAGLIDRSMLLCYEIIEFEPTPPATVIQFDDIRRVIRQELKYANLARGCMGNSQQPVMVLPNLYFFARAVWDPNYLDRTDQEVLTDLAEFLDGPAEVLCPAWECLRLGLDHIPADLQARLADCELRSEAAQYIPGGPQRYLTILAKLVETRLQVLQVCREAPPSPRAAADTICRATKALVEWWNVHRYVFSGEVGYDFRWGFSHPLLRGSVEEWIAKYVQDREAVMGLVTKELVEQGILPEPQASSVMAELLEL